MSELRFSKERLAQLMDDRGLGDAQLAKKVGVSRTTIFNLRKGRRQTARAELMARIADALATTVDYLLGEGEDRPPMPEAISRLSEVANRLSEIRQEELVRMAEALEKLEREQPTYALPARAMEVLLDVAAKMGIEDEILGDLEALLGSQPPTRLIDLGPGELLDDPGDDE